MDDHGFAHYDCFNVCGGENMNGLVWGIIGVVFSPFLGGLISGVDRIITARMQSRVGPPLFQPFYDVLKLFEKEKLIVNKFHFDFIICSLIFTIASVAMFFAGDNLLIAMFTLIVGNVFVVLGAYSSNSPYSILGAERELLQILASEPMILLTSVGLFMMTNSFDVADIVKSQVNLILYLPGVFLALLYVLTIKLRKSPFDLSTSQHAHQELVKGLSTEFAGPSLGYFEIIHWYEMIFILALLYLFFASMPIIGIFAILFVYFLEIVIDNINARVKWEWMLGSSWLITLIFGVGNLMVIYFIQH